MSIGGILKEMLYLASLITTQDAAPNYYFMFRSLPIVKIFFWLTPLLCAALLTVSGAEAAHISASAKAGTEKHPANTATKHSSSVGATNEPVLINADTMGYDQETETVTASGHVEIYQSQRVVLADSITYNQKTDTLTAEGNISVLEPSGDVFFAKHLELTDQMKKGVIEHFQARLSDNSLFSSNSATRVSEDVTVLKKAIYSPCPLCESNPKIPPAWQIKANKTTIDTKEQKISYNHAFFETYGVPILYTPYFSHATPHADRKSGFLTPTYSSISSLGSTVKIPYYINIAPNMDSTVTPYLTTSEGPVMAAEFRHLTENGTYKLSGSITDPKDYRAPADDPDPGHRMRGHIEGEGRFHFYENWDSGFNFKRATDDTYLGRYQFGNEDFLTSRLYTERIKERDYAIAQGLAFQELTSTNDSEKTPLVLPLLSSHNESSVAENGSRWTLDTNAMMLSRRGGTDSNRLSSTVGWQIPYITSSGNVFNTTLSMRGDIYQVQDVSESDSSETEHGGVGRAIPQVKVDWRYPLMKNAENYDILLEPTANLIISPYSLNPSKIPNEDSQEIELTDNNLFKDNRFTGLDRLEDGPRTNYGLRSIIRNHSGQSGDFLFGQSYRMEKENDLPEGSGLNDNFSDYVGRIGVKPIEMLDLAYRFRLDKETLEAHRNEIDTTLTYAPITWNVSYIELNDTSPPRKQIYSSAAAELSKQWTITADGRRDLEGNGGMISNSGRLIHHGDCVSFITSLTKEYTTDQDIQPSTAITFQVFLKNIN